MERKEETSIRAFLAIEMAAACFVAFAPRIAAADEICPAKVSYFYGISPDGHSPLPKGNTNQYAFRVGLDSDAAYLGAVTLFTDSEAYTFNYTPAQFRGVQGGLPFLVRLPKSVDVQYAAVDTAQPENGELISCPTYVVQRDDSQDAGVRGSEGYIPEQASPVIGTLRAPLPALKCGKTYEDARLLGTADYDMYAPVRDAVALIDMLIDSDGKAAFARIVTSSGDQAVDAIALKTARTAHYRPAYFRCVPVIGRYRFRFEYTVQ